MEEVQIIIGGTVREDPNNTREAHIKKAHQKAIHIVYVHVPIKILRW